MLLKNDIKLVKSLGDKEGRREAGLFVVEGEKMVGEALASDMTVAKVFVSSSYSGRLSGVFETEMVSPAEMARLSKLKTAPPCIALVRIPDNGYETAWTFDGGELTIMLDDVQDPGNVGNILRIADWFGISRLICSPATADIYNPKVVQASMGSVFRVAVNYAALPPVLSRVRDAGLHIYGTFLEGVDIYEAGLSAGGILILGNEGRGISAAVEGYVSDKIYIPSYPAGRQGPESLNVAAAASIACSEFRRRLR